MPSDRGLVKYILYTHKWKTMQLLKKKETNLECPRSDSLESQDNNVGWYKPGMARGRLVGSKPREGSWTCVVLACRPHQWLEETRCFVLQGAYKQEPSQSGLWRKGRGEVHGLAPPVPCFQLGEFLTSQLGPDPCWHPGRWDLCLVLWCFIRVPKWRDYRAQEEHWPREKEGAVEGILKDMWRFLSQSVYCWSIK